MPNPSPKILEFITLICKQLLYEYYMKLTKISLDKSKQSNFKVSVTTLKNSKKTYTINLFGFEIRISE